MNYEGKEYPGHYQFFPEKKQKKAVMHWEGNPKDGQEFTILGETDVITVFHGRSIGNNRWIVEQGDFVTDLAKRWFEIQK